MKLLLIILATAAALPTYASWTQIVACNNGELVVDRGDKDALGRPTYQLVLRGQPLHHFIQKGAIEPKDVNGRGEFVIGLNTHQSRLMGFRSHGVAANGMHTYRNYWITRHQNSVFLQTTVGNRYTGESEQANWHFHNCYRSE